ncbi:lactococcin 972 family bacteriocin [Streptococcus parasanguinis]
MFSYDSGWKSFLGGKWRHGVGSRYVWSKYDHNNKTHKNTVQGASGQFSYSG